MMTAPMRLRLKCEVVTMMAGLSGVCQLFEVSGHVEKEEQIAQVQYLILC